MRSFCAVTALLTLCVVPIAPVTPERAAAIQLPAGFEVLRSLDVGQAPHGIRFSADGNTAYVALSGDDEIAVVDLQEMRVVDRWPAEATPLDLVALESGGWAVTQFRGESVTSHGTGGASRTWAVGSSPSLFGARIVDGIAPLVSEFADQLTLFDVRSGEVVATYPTGKRPYPAEITADGVLAFVPNRDAGTVSVIDLLGGSTLAEVAVCTHPEGGTLTVDDVSYIVACGGSNELVYVNTASFEVTARVEGVGPRPFSVAVTADGRYGVAINAGGTTVSILDVDARKIVGELSVGEQPIVVRMHPDGRRAFVSSEVSGTLTEIALPPVVEPERGDAVTEVVVFGMIHGSHRTSEQYGLEVLRDAIRAVSPDLVMVEIPPNRFDAAAAGFAADGRVSEPRVLVFPEYVDVLFPLTLEMDFEIVPTAGWTRPMSDHRNAVLRAIQEDPSRADDWAAYEASNTASTAAARAGGASDDPQWIHTDAYDEAQEIGLSVYNRLFNEELGPGGWDNINRAHYANIAGALDRIAGTGQRVLITYGAGHKGWFLRQLRQRDDIELLDARRFFDH